MSPRSPEILDAVIIVNPAANNGRNPHLKETIQELLVKKGLSIPIWESRRPGNEGELAIEALHKKARLVMVAGGDGTLHHVAQRLHRTDTALGVLPTGTGNDYAKSLGISKDLSEALHRAITGERRRVDVGFINEHFFLNVASLGLDAKISHRAEKLKEKLRSSLAYKLAIFGELKEGSKSVLRMGGKTEDFLLFAMGKGSYYGGGIPILPAARLEDGLLSFCRIKSIPPYKILVLLPVLLAGKHEKLKKIVTMEKAAEMEWELLEEEVLNLDGEIFPLQGKIYCRVDPSSLWVQY